MISYLEDEGLHEEGILRVPGSAARINALQQELEASFNEGTFSFEGKRVTDVCSLLKQFIRWGVRLYSFTAALLIHFCSCFHYPETFQCPS